MTDSLKEVVAALDRGRALQRGAWVNVQEQARKLHQMKTTGSYVDGRGCLLTVSGLDVESHVQMMTHNLMTAVEQACIEDAQMGATFNKHLG